MADDTGTKWFELEGSGTLHGFTMPDPTFDPNDNEFIREYYRKKEERGPLNPEDGIEDDVEEEAKKVVAEWEKVEGRKATEEERNIMMEKVRRLRVGNWLEGARTQLVGKKEVPIAWFNRVVAENEACIGYVAKQMAAVAKERREMYTTIKDLRSSVQQLEIGASNAIGAYDNAWKEERERMLSENGALREQNAQLQKDLAEAQSNSENAELQGKVERLQSELNGAYEERRELNTKMESLEDQLNESRKRENSLKESLRGDSNNEEEISSNLRTQNESLLNTIESLTRQRDELRGRLQDNPTGTTGGTGAIGDFDTMEVLREIKRAAEAGGEVSAEATQLIDRWLSRVADAQNLQEFHNAVTELRDNMTDLQKRVVSFYKALGVDDDTLDAGEILTKLEAFLSEQPKEDPVKLMVWGLKQQFEIQMKDQMLQAEDKKNQTLRVQLEMAKPAAQIETEMKMKYGIFNNEELEKMVDSRTQVFRQHRRDMLDNLFAAATTLTNIAMRCPDERTRRDIQHVTRDYLNPISLPGPSSQPPR
ncbi:hypothetical protein F4776DRAFT_670897 [Hypoxylon sp. NC0597]|nr:hypothetical protein F4776DRAFT_670897 [Hypoxylon sp. NC0597]